jgi:hypothetical protein
MSFETGMGKLAIGIETAVAAAAAGGFVAVPLRVARMRTGRDEHAEA